MPCAASGSLEPLLACRSLIEAGARLACFDREAAALAASAGTPATPAKPPPAASALDPQQQFGLPEKAVAANEVAAGTRAAAASKIEAHITGLGQTADGLTVFTLDNGQVWRQLNAGGDLLAKLGDAATISRGLLGSYWLQLGSGRGCKATRLR